MLEVTKIAGILEKYFKFLTKDCEELHIKSAMIYSFADFIIDFLKPMKLRQTAQRVCSQNQRNLVVHYRFYMSCDFELCLITDIVKPNKQD